MVFSAKDTRFRELKDMASQLKTMVSEQTKLIQSFRLIVDEKSSHEKALQEQKVSDNRVSLINLSLAEEEIVIQKYTRKQKSVHADLFKELKVKKQ